MITKEQSEEIKNELSIEQVSDLLASLGGDPFVKGEVIISRTICHAGESHKLYYYNNTKLFKCFTNCGDEAFDIYDLVRKEKKTEGIEMTLPQATYYIINFFNLVIENNVIDDNSLEDWKIFKKYEEHNIKEEKEEKIIEFKYYDDSILKYLPTPRILPWEREGITKEVLQHCGICYNPVSQGIVIPHFNKEGLLLGIRERTLIKEEENNGKYKPAILNYKMYNHPLGFNLYNLNNSKNNISDFKKVIIFEGEKSCLLYQSYFGISADISVAVCGSSLTNYQVNLLMELGIDEICIAFDKQFQEIGDEEWKKWKEKLTNINNKYSSMIKVSFLFDKWNLLGYKDSPIDKGPNIFQELFKRRVIL